MRNRLLIAASGFVAGFSVAILGVLNGRIQVSDDKKSVVIKSDKD